MNYLFILIKKNDYKNLKTIFEKCNLKVKKFLTKSFIEGAHISNNYKNNETFSKLKFTMRDQKFFILKIIPLSLSKILNLEIILLSKISQK